MPSGTWPFLGGLLVNLTTSIALLVLLSVARAEVAILMTAQGLT
jgi:hypothetical protein